MQNSPKINIFLIVKLYVQEKEPFFFIFHKLKLPGINLLKCSILPSIHRKMIIYTQIYEPKALRISQLLKKRWLKLMMTTESLIYSFNTP